MASEHFPSSKKIKVPGTLHPELRVPMREISLTGEAPVYTYDTSGPYTDPEATIDLGKGLEPLRRSWILGRGDVAGEKPLRAKPGRNVSQMHYAKKGVITHEMEYVAIRENLLLDKMR